MQQLNKNTKRAQHFTNAYESARACSLSDVYGTYSHAKARAEIECLEMMKEEDGTGFRIISANTLKFTAAWKTPQGLRVETAAYSYLIA